LNGSTQSSFITCWDEVAGTGTPIIDMGGSGQSLQMRSYSGGIELINKSGDDPVSLDFISGHAKLASSVTAGDIVIRGFCRVTDNSDGAIITQEHTGATNQDLDFITTTTYLIHESMPHLGQWKRLLVGWGSFTTTNPPGLSVERKIFIAELMSGK